MLKDMAFDNSKRKCKNNMGQVFCIESYKKIRYEQQNPVNWKIDTCISCRMPLKVEPTNFKTLDDEMSFGDFVIRYEHKFLKNIYTNEQIKDSYHLKDLESYYEIFEEYITICDGLLVLIINFNRNDFINSAIQNSVENKFYRDEITEIKNTLAKTEIKKTLYHQHLVRFRNLI